MRGGGGMRRGFFKDRWQGEGDGFVRPAIAAWQRPRRGPVLALSLGGAVLIAAIALATALAVYASRDRAIRRAKRELENNAHLLSRHYEQLLGDFAAVMKSVAAEIELDRISSTGHLQTHDGYRCGSPDAGHAR